MICVADVMSRRVRTVDSSATLKEAAKRMAKWRIGSLVIVERGKPAGIITEGDVSKAVAKGLNPFKTSVSFKRKKLVTVGPTERLEGAARIMAAAGVKKLPVMEGGKLVGIITQTDIVESSFALVTSLNEMVSARYRPPDFVP
ncbi:MAG: CBS domain-containing protein [Nitrososphaerales archaeon]|nr:CBS domain-containing protein [Nitrososphaerales archaeon]